MKPYILLLVSLFAIQAFAGEPICKTEMTADAVVQEQLEIKTDVPSHLKGATIIVRLADGRETSVPAEKFKVVPRKQQFIVTRTLTATETSCTAAIDPRRHRVSVLGGHGSQAGLSPITINAAGQAEVESKVGLVGGLQYQFLLPILDDRFSLGVQGQTNKTFSATLGVDF